MTARPSRQSLTLAVHPTWAGFGWIAFESPLGPFDWSLVYVKLEKNAVCLRKIEKLFDRLTPETLVLEAFERESARADRIQKLCRAIVNIAVNRGIEVAILSRQDVRACFARVGAVTRYEIAEAVARTLDAFRHRLPPRRRTWEKEDPRLSLFSAAALVLTHYGAASSKLLDDLRDAA